jgi:ribosomal-protein-alanine N-acetyltransferase
MSVARPIARTGQVAPEQLETERLLLRRPRAADAAGIFTRYGADPDVTRYLSWPRHTALDDARVFVGFSDTEWRQWGCGPYLVFSRAGGLLLGSTGLAFETADVASTGYLFARDSWGLGYATETLRVMTDLAQSLEVVRLYAICHPDNRASQRVLEKCGFLREGILRRHTTFPNLAPDRADVVCYARTF